MLPQDIIEKIKLPFRKDKELYLSFYQILGFYPKHIDIYRQALRHKSSSIKTPKGWINNERLEFLGDAVLGSIVGEIVYHHFQNKREGFLTNTRSKIVKRETLNKIAHEIGLDKLITSSAQANAHNSYVGGNAFEALIGAIYLDRGYKYCMRFISGRILQKLIDLDQLAYKEVNFKSKLIEWGQKHHLQMHFKLLEQKKGEKGSPLFYTQVVIEGVPCGKAQGYSKKESQQAAAKETLRLFRKKDKELQNQIFEAKSQRTATEKITY